MVKKRVFLAINIPPEERKTLMGCLEELRSKNPWPSIKWVEERNVHLTLHFFGDLTQDQIARLNPVLSKVAGEYAPFTLTLTPSPLRGEGRGEGAFGFFPNAEAPRVLFVGFEKSPPLDGLIASLCTGLRVLGVPLDARPFHSHLTLARLNFASQNLGGNGTIKLTIDGVHIPRMTFPVRSFDLMESVLQPTGPVYTVIQSFSLGGR